MKTTTTLLETIKEGLYQKMIENFENDGELTPFAYFVVNDEDKTKLIFLMIEDGLSTPENKELLGLKIKEMCRNPLVIAAGMVIEAYTISAKMDDPADMALMDLIGDKIVNIRDLPERKDAILMIFATPVSQESIMHIVDVENKKIKEKIDGSDIGGTFSNFFEFNKN